MNDINGENIVRCSLFCIVNDNKMYEGLLKNISAQVDLDFKIIPFMNIQNDCKGARIAYNSLLKDMEGEYAVFLHPDIRFLDKHALRDIIDFCDSLGNFGVVGIAGCPENLINGKRIIYSSIFHGERKVKVGSPILQPAEVQTVDECFFVFRREVICKLGFEEAPGWHLYAAEQCLRVKKIGLNCYVIPSNVWHLSDGKSLDPSYVKQIDILIQAYKDQYQNINTTVKKWKTSGMLSYLYRRYYYIKQRLKKGLRGT